MSNNKRNQNGRSVSKSDPFRDVTNSNLRQILDTAQRFGYTTNQMQRIADAFKNVEGTSFEQNFGQSLGLYGVQTHNTWFSRQGTAARDVRDQKLADALAAIAENQRQQDFNVDYEDPLSQVSRQRAVGINTDLSGTVDAGDVNASENDTVNPPVVPGADAGLPQVIGTIGNVLSIIGSAFTSGLQISKMVSESKIVAEAASQAAVQTANEIEEAAAHGVLDTLELNTEFQNGWKFFSEGSDSKVQDAAINKILKENEAALLESESSHKPLDRITKYDPKLKGAEKTEEYDWYHGLDKRYSSPALQERFRQAFKRQLKSIRTAGDYYALRTKYADSRDAWMQRKGSKFYSDDPSEVFNSLLPIAGFSDQLRESLSEASALKAAFEKAYYMDASGQWLARSENAANEFNARYLGFEAPGVAAADGLPGLDAGVKGFADAKRAAEMTSYRLSSIMSDTQVKLFKPINDCVTYLSGYANSGNFVQRTAAISSLVGILAAQSQLFGSIFSGMLQSFGGPSSVSNTYNSTTVEQAASVNGKGVIVTPQN